MTEPEDLLDLHLAVLFTQDEQGNLVATNDPEPDQVAAPRLYLGRGPGRSVLRFRRGMDESTRAALRDLAAPDLTANDPNHEPVNLAAIEALLAAEQSIQNVYFGPAFRFPDVGAVTYQGRRAGPVPSPSMGEGEGEGAPRPRSGMSTSEAAASESREQSPGPLRHSGEGRSPDPSTADVIGISPSTTHLLSPEFAWLADELTVRNPVMAVIVDGVAVSVCFSARSTSLASEAGVETLPEHRGRRYAGAVTAAWAAEVQRQGRIPLYSTSWTNHASRRVAARLGLIQYATDFHIT
ncbi:MAG: GNAT family N-acetyltransferase [Chloroflexi bacterium]|nr:GNAT family N-acetyltransferase [Chloroflexota bacterium]